MKEGTYKKQRIASTMKCSWAIIHNTAE